MLDPPQNGSHSMISTQQLEQGVRGQWHAGCCQKGFSIIWFQDLFLDDLCWKWQFFDGRNPANQLRLVVYPIIYEGCIHPKWCRISCINKISSWMTFVSKRSPTVGPTDQTPKKPEYRIARSQLTKVRSVCKVPFNFWWIVESDKALFWVWEDCTLLGCCFVFFCFFSSWKQNR